MSIINNSYGFIFVHVPKAAGTSVTNALSRLTNYCDQEIGGTSFGEQVQPAYRDRFGLAKHSTALEIRALVGQVTWGKYFSFAFVRNPFSRCLSTYNFLRQWKGGSGHFFDRMRSFESFEEYVLSDIWDKSNGPDEIFRPQSYWVRDRDSMRVITSYLGKVENLAADLGNVLEVVGAPIHVIKEFSVPHLNQSLSEGSIVSREQHVIDKIALKYKIDFENFGYAPSPEA